MSPDLRAPAYATTYFTFVLGTLANLVRLYARAFIQKTWGIDDCFAIGVLVGRFRES